MLPSTAPCHSVCTYLNRGSQLNKISEHSTIFLFIGLRENSYRLGLSSGYFYCIITPTFTKCSYRPVFPKIISYKNKKWYWNIVYCILSDKIATNRELAKKFECSKIAINKKNTSRRIETTSIETRFLYQIQIIGVAGALLLVVMSISGYNPWPVYANGLTR